MEKLVQICASSNDLFGLDEGGDVYQYNFSAKAWVKLAHGSSRQDEGSEFTESATAYRDAMQRRGGERR
ncbi:MAG TPA: hypothetical protein VNN07_13840 [Candidatus Tectomicrobia bacterium]|nr:hypothetical protein [Candidatus Tectomicrobia bacterium]